MKVKQLEWKGDEFQITAMTGIGNFYIGTKNGWSELEFRAKRYDGLSLINVGDDLKALKKDAQDYFESMISECIE